MKRLVRQKEISIGVSDIYPGGSECLGRLLKEVQVH
jgi:hypothetical protein